MKYNAVSSLALWFNSYLMMEGLILIPLSLVEDSLNLVGAECNFNCMVFLLTLFICSLISLGFLDKCHRCLVTYFNFISHIATSPLITYLHLVPDKVSCFQQHID